MVAVMAGGAVVNTGLTDGAKVERLAGVEEAALRAFGSRAAAKANRSVGEPGSRSPALRSFARRGLRNFHHDNKAVAAGIAATAFRAAFSYSRKRPRRAGYWLIDLAAYVERCAFVYVHCVQREKQNDA